MDKLKMHTSDIADENYRKLADLFPDAITETTDEDGNIVRAIDADVLMQEINRSVVKGDQQRYQFTWPDKRKALNLANTPTTKTLRFLKEKSVGRDGTPGGTDSENIYIEGDNLDALKLLRETYLGKVKMIYIDPPYNTGTDFIYKDDFTKKVENYKESSGQYADDGNRLIQNMETNGRYHTDWLNMIYPRLKLAKDFLTDDGVIFISIDEGEASNLKKICDEIFGGQNFVSNLIWQSRTSISNDFEVSLNHNQTLIYSKNRLELKFGGDPIDESDYSNPDNDPRGPWKLVPLDANHAGGNTVYPIRNPKTGKDYFPPNGRIWCYNQKDMMKLMADGRIKFGLTDDSSPKRKLYLNERLEKGDKKTPSSLLLDAGTTKDGTAEIMNLFDGLKVFDYPKSVGLLERLIRYGAPSGGIVFDFFSGSGTTAQAVLKLSSENYPDLKYILVQLPENLDESVKKASSKAKKTLGNAIQVLDSLHSPHLLSNISEERIKRAGNVIKNKNNADIDYGFRCFKVDSSNMKNVYYIPSQYDQSLFERLADNIKEDRTPEDLLIQVMLDLGIELSSKVEKTNIEGKEVFSVADGYMLACFDKDVTDEVVKTIAERHPFYAVFRDNSMATDSVAVNFDQIFNTYSPKTIRKVL